MTNLIRHSLKQRSHRLVYIGLAVIIALLYDVLFWGQGVGLNVALLTTVYVLAFSAVATTTNQIRNPLAFLFLIPISILCFDVLNFNNTLVTQWIPWVIVILTAIFSILLTIQNPNKLKFTFRGIPILTKIDLMFRKWSHIVKDLTHTSKGEQNKNVIKKVLIGVGLSLPILLVFGSFFAQADPIFADFFQNKLFNDLNPSLFWRTFRTFGVSLWIAGFLYVLISEDHVLNHTPSVIKKQDSIIVGVVLTLVNALFVLFVVIQIKYLFGNENFVLENGLIFANYARQGFFELAWVVTLAGIMIIAIYRWFVAHGSPKIITLLQLILITQVAVVALSALKRMNIYQDVFGYTVLRLYVEWFIYLIFILLTFSGFSLFLSIPFRKYVNASLVIGVIALVTVASINVDRVIAKENVDRYLESEKELDMRYLTQQLSIDAYAEVERAFEGGFTDNAFYAPYINTYERQRQNKNKNIVDKTNFPLLYIKFSDKYVYEKDGYKNWKDYNSEKSKVGEAIKDHKYRPLYSIPLD